MMPATVEAVLVATDPTTFVTCRLPKVELDFGGIPGDRHYGLTRRSGAREPMYRRGTEIRNRRQISAVSAEECSRIAQQLGLTFILPEWLGANLLLSGFPDLTQLPTGTRLVFSSGACLVCEGENLPCRYPGEVIQALHTDRSIRPKDFVRVAQGLRGIVCSVERSGCIGWGDSVQILHEQSANMRVLATS